MKLLVLLFLFLTVFACANSVSVQENCKTIDIDVDKSIEFFYADKLLDTIGHEIIVLDTAKDSFVRHTNKFFVEDGKLYVWDDEYKTIFIYGSDGRYLSKIASQGRARNEYASIDDFYVANGRMYILDNLTMKILEYDSMGNYIKALDVSMFWAERLFVQDSAICLINYSSETDNGQYHIFKIDEDGELKDKYLKFDRSYQHVPDLKAYSKVDDVFSLCMPANMIYLLDSMSCRPFYHVNFVNKNLPDEYYEKDLRKLLEEKKADKYITGIDQIQESTRYLFIYFWYDWEYYTAIYDKVNDCVTVCKDILMLSMYKMEWSNYYIINDYVYSIVDASSFKILVEEIVKKNPMVKDKYIAALEQLNKKITDYSNPIIIKYKLKS